MRRGWTAAVALVVVACGDDASPGDAGVNGAPDAAAGDAAGGDAPNTPRTVTVGTGKDAFEPLADGDVVPLERGAQAGGRFDGFHILSGVRMSGFARDELEFLTVQIRDAAGDVRAELPRDPDIAPIFSSSPDVHEIWNLQPRIDDCCRVENGDVIVFAEVEASDGTTHRGEVRIATGACVDDGGNDPCP